VRPPAHPRFSFGVAAIEADGSASSGPRNDARDVNCRSPGGVSFGFDCVLPELASGSVEDLALEPFVHRVAPGGRQVLKLRAWVTAMM
jgi:hypothetical protein